MLSRAILPSMDTTELAPRLAALGNETRLEIYRILVRAGPSGMPVSGIQSRLEIPASTLSHHLRALCEVGLVAQKRDGTRLICHADFRVLETTFATIARECCSDSTSCKPSPPPSSLPLDQNR